jgi:hypothetical protein
LPQLEDVGGCVHGTCTQDGIFLRIADIDERSIFISCR